MKYYKILLNIVLSLSVLNLYGEEMKTAQSKSFLCSQSALNELKEIRASELSKSIEVEDRVARNDMIHLRAIASLNPNTPNYDIERSICFLHFLQDDDHLPSLNKLIRIYALNENYLDKEKAKEFAKKGSYMNDATSQYYLYILLKENETYLNKERYQWLSESHRKGYTPATCTLASKLFREGDHTEGIKLSLEGAKKYNRNCMFQLAMAYINGEGVSKSDCEGLEWAKKAAGLGSENAKRLLAEEVERFKKCSQLENLELD